MKTYRKWSKEEEEFLRENYGKMPTDEICRLLNRTVKSIYIKAEWLRLKGARPRGYGEATCPFCGKVFTKRAHNSKYCSKACKEGMREAKRKECVEKRGTLRSPRRTSDAIKRMVFAAQEVLPKHGFKDIMLVKTFLVHFPFDILARRGGELCGIDITTEDDYKLNKKKKPLIRYLRIRTFVCFLKPDFSSYSLKEVKL